MLIAHILLSFFCQVSTKELEENNSNVTIGTFLKDLYITPFLDDNHYIRLNLSWGLIQGEPTRVSFKFGTSEECNQVNEIYDHFLDNNQFIIIPSMQLKHPADQLIHRCKYEIVIEDNVFNNHTNQTFYYQIPECVQDLCDCADPNDSPSKINEIAPLSDGLYSITWDKSGKYNLTIHEIYYQTVNSKIRTHIPESNLTMISNGVKIPMGDLINGVTYNVTVIFTDVYDACNYYASFPYYVPEKYNKKIIVTICLVLVVLVVVTSYCFLKRCCSLGKKRLDTLKKYSWNMPFKISSEEETIINPVALCNRKEELNCQYTPYEFIKNQDKFDKYEIPSNKVILEDEIGKGAFGTVYQGKIYGFLNSGFTSVAVKLLREGAPEEEAFDFLNEINLFKKIGEHQNIIKLIACVTISQPYMMVMELVSKESLKSYLLKLRKKWDQNKNQRIFFPDDMEITAFQGSVSKDSDGQYIEPDDVFDESDSSSQNKSFLAKSKIRNPEFLGFKPTSPRELKYAPNSPSSITSSRLPSSTETETTIVDLETPTRFNSKCGPKPILSNTELQEFAFQIASGMAYLEKQNITHRDLAARNILMTSNKSLKISDFGLSRIGPYVRNRCKKLPLRWMAIEAIENSRCDSKCDVWSFGVVLWEIGTLGAFPYEGVRDSILLHSLKNGLRLERPEICTTELYHLMTDCWLEDPEKRPTFQEIKGHLDIKKRQVYVNFDFLNPCYVFPPTKKN